MKCLYLIYTRSLLLAMLLLCTFTVSAIDYGDVPTNLVPPAGWSDDKWTDPGGWTTIDVTKYGLVPGNQSINATAKVRDIISSTRGKGNRILYFPEGSYWFTSTLVITESGIRLKGAGASKSKLYQRNAEFIFRSPDSSDEKINLSSSPSRGDTSLKSSNAGQLKKGDFILPLAQFPYGANGGSSNNTYRNQMSKEGRGQIVTVKSVSGNSIQISEPMGLNFASWPDQRIERLTMQKNVGIENLRIEKLVEDKKDTFTMERVTNGFIRNVRFKQTHKKTIETRLCYRIFIEGNNISDGWNKTKGGHAYGMQLNRNTTRAYVTNNKLERLRHGIVLQQGANHCVVAYNHTVSNILLHGNYANNNLFEGNVIDKAINFDAVHGINGPYNFIFRNVAIDPSGGNKGIGYLKGADPQIVIGNVTGLLELEDGEYAGANREGTKNYWGSLSASSQLPDSLYLNSKPSFMGSKPWPIAGPDLGSNWGASNTNPAHDRAREDVPPYEGGPVVPEPEPEPEPENKAPVSTITSPVNGTSLLSSEAFSVLVNAEDSDGQVKKVDLFINGSYYDTDTTAGYKFDIDGLNAGSYTLFTRVYDNDGAQSKSADVKLTVKDPTTPTNPGGEDNISFVYPKDGEILNEGTDLYVKVSAPDSKNVKLYLNGVLVRRESRAPYEWGKESQPDTVLANLSGGDYELKAVAETLSGERVNKTISFKVKVAPSSGSGRDLNRLIEAEDIDDHNGVASSNGKLSNITSGEWVRYENFDFGSGAESVEFFASAKNDGGDIELRLGSIDGTLIGTVTVVTTGSWNNYLSFSAPLNEHAVGVHDYLYLVFTNGSGYLMDIDSFEFNELPDPDTENLVD